jgi:hypothetical protein
MFLTRFRRVRYKNVITSSAKFASTKFRSPEKLEKTTSFDFPAEFSAGPESQWPDLH